MNDARLLAAWMGLLGASLRSGAAAQQAWEQLAAQPELAQAVRQWWVQAFPDVAPPPAGSPPSDNALQRWIDEWQKAMGVVPRERYLALLEENDTLRHRLREAEATVERLRGSQAGAGSGAPNYVGEVWNQLLQDSFKSQAEWLKLWRTAGTDEAGRDAAEDGQ